MDEKKVKYFAKSTVTKPVAYVFVFFSPDIRKFGLIFAENILISRSLIFGSTASSTVPIITLSTYVYGIRWYVLPMDCCGRCIELYKDTVNRVSTVEKIKNKNKEQEFVGQRRIPTVLYVMVGNDCSS